MIYANTAFTMTTGVQAGRVLDEGALATEVRAMFDGDARAAPGPARRRASDAGLRKLFALEAGLVGMVLDAGAHEALAVLAEEQSALRRVATLVASGPEPRGRLSGRGRGGRPAAARALGGDVRYEDGLRAGPSGAGRTSDLGGFEVGTSVPLTDSDGLTAIVARTGRSGADRGLRATCAGGRPS